LEKYFHITRAHRRKGSKRASWKFKLYTGEGVRPFECVDSRNRICKK
jgi:hypothetical protein